MSFHLPYILNGTVNFYCPRSYAGIPNVQILNPIVSLCFHLSNFKPRATGECFIYALPRLLFDLKNFYIRMRLLNYRFRRRSSHSTTCTPMGMLFISLCTKNRLMRRGCSLSSFETIQRTRSLSNSLRAGLHMHMIL